MEFAVAKMNRKLSKIFRAGNYQMCSTYRVRTQKGLLIRFWVKYSKFNALAIPVSLPLPCVDEHINSLGEAIVFSILDASSGYLPTEIDECD